MAINEQILTGKKYRVLADENAGLWNRISFWNKASDTEMNDGRTVEDALNGVPTLSDTISTTPAVPRDADTLGGKYTAADIDDLTEGLNTSIKFPNYDDVIKTVETTVWSMTPLIIEEDCYIMGQTASKSDTTAGVWINGTTAFNSIAYATLGNSCAVYGFIPKGTTIYYRGAVYLKFVRVKQNA